MNKLFDCHCHCFNVDDTPMKTVLKRYGLQLWFAMHHIPFIKVDERARNYVTMIERIPLDIVKNLKNGIQNFVDSEKTDMFNIKDIYVVLLTMFFSKDDAEKNITSQIDNIKLINQFYKGTNFHIIPFLGVDPTINSLTDIISIVGKDKAFMGLKIYPPLDVDILSTQAIELFKYCSINKIPITAHCNGGGFISRSITEKKSRELCHPDKWNKVLKLVPELILNLAHFGGRYQDWESKIIKLMHTYPNVYSDISYTLKDIDYTVKLLLDCLKDRILSSKILFGTDYYMYLTEKNTYSELVTPIKRAIDILNFEKIACTNPQKFLGL